MLRPVGALFLASALACGGEPTLVDGTADPITDIPNTSVKEQYVGTCWLYTTAAWAESMHLAATGETLNLSETYWTYWVFFERIVAGEIGEYGDLRESGSWGVAAGLIERYGIMREGDFIPEEANSAASDRTIDGFNAILTSLSAGALATPAARKDRALVRAELDAAFALRPEAVAWLDATFGKDGKKVFTPTAGAPAGGAPIVHAKDFVVKGTPASRKATLSLSDYLGRDAPDVEPNKRVGLYAWQLARFPATQPRQMLTRAQKAMQDGFPLVLAWNVESKALETDGTFKSAQARGPIEAHLSLLVDYQASNVPGFGTLPVGKPEARPEALAAALDPSAVIDLLRIKNSWGDKPRQETVVPAGYHDLYRSYYEGTLKACDDDSCTPLPATSYLMLPPGY